DNPPLFCARRTPAKTRQNGHSGSFLRSRLRCLSKYLEITEITETTETTGADLRKRQSSQTSQSSHTLSHCHGKTSSTPVTHRHRLQSASRHESRAKRAKGIGTAVGMRTQRAWVLVRPTWSGGLRLPWSRPVVSVVSVVSVDSVSTETTGPLSRRNVRFVWAA